MGKRTGQEPSVKVSVDTSAPSAEQPAQGRRPAGSDDAREQGRRTRVAADRARRQATAWFDGVAPGHGNAVLFGIAGLAVALVILFVGFFQALLIAVLVLAGVAFGQWLDGDPVIVNGIARLFRSGDNS